MKQTLNDFIGASYTFNTATKQITISGIDVILNETNVWSIINVTTGTIIQRLDKYVIGISSINNNVITLRGSVAGMSDTDKLVFIFDVDAAIIDRDSNATLSILKSMLNMLEPSGTRNSINQQVVAIGNAPQTLGYYAISTATPSIGIPTIGTTYYTPSWAGPNDPRESYLRDSASSYAISTRANLSFN